MADMISWLDSHFGPALVRIASTLFPRRPVIQFEAGPGVTITAADVPANKATKLTFGATAVVPSGTDGALQYKSGGANASANDFLYAGGRLTVSASGFIAYEAATVPASGLIRIPYDAGSKAIITRKDSLNADRAFLSFTADAAILGAGGAFNVASSQVSLFSGTPTYGGGTQVLYQAGSIQPPSTNPTGGILKWVENGTFLERSRHPSGKIVNHDGTSPETNGFRLTLSSGNPIPLANVTAASFLYLTPFRSGSIAIHDAVTWVRRESSEVSIVLSGLVADKLYDVFAWWAGGVLALELSAAWTNDTTRSEALTRLDGVLVKSADTRRRYVGTIRTVTASTTEDSSSKRFVYNESNQVERHALVSDPTASWSYALTTVRQARATAANRVEVVVGQPRPCNVRVRAVGTATVGSGVALLPGVGIDSTTVDSGTPAATFSSNSFATEINLSTSEYDGVLAAGYHAINWLERISGASNMTLYGTSGSVSNLRARVTM